MEKSLFFILRNLRYVFCGAIIAFGVSIVLWYIFGLSSSYTNFPPPPTGPVVIFGDSLVSGVGATNGNNLATILTEKLHEKVIGKGVSGNTTSDALARLHTDVLSLEPRVVIILLGGNDFLRKYPKKETFLNLDMIIENIQHTGAFVVLAGVQGGILLDGVEDDFRLLAKHRGALYVPNVLDGLLGNPTLMHDAIHPNNEGYAVIAEKIFKKMIDEKVI